MSLEKDIIKMIKTASASQSNVTDTTATVVRTEGTTAWVHFDEGVAETPVEMTISCKAGDTVRVRVADGNAYLVGNGTAPPTDDSTAIVARTVAVSAQTKANSAQEDANAAAEAASSAQASADTAAIAAGNAKTAADNAAIAAGNAQTSANAAKASADNAGEYASRALGNLASVQSVSETLTWITAHGTMTLTADVALDPTHVYFVVDAAGDYTVGGVKYSIVTEPKLADIGTYYELSIDESLNNYVATHLALDTEGLWVIPDTTNDFKVLIATGSGSTYTTAGTYIVDGSGYTVAQFTATELSLQSNGVEMAHFGYDSGTDSGGGTSTAPYSSIGQRLSGSTIGNYSTAEGYDTTASGYASLASGQNTIASGHFSNASGQQASATGLCSQAGGRLSIAKGDYSVALGYRARAVEDYQVAVGRFNEGKSDTVFEVGYGSMPGYEQNVFEVVQNGVIRTGNAAGIKFIHDGRLGYYDELNGKAYHFAGRGEKRVTIATSGWSSESYTALSGAVYAYKYEISVSGMLKSSWADISLYSGTFTGNFAVETGADTLIIRTSSQPSTSLTFDIMYMV